MLFKRREKQGRWERLRLWLWPRVSWRRSSLYFLKRILRLSGTPYAIAMGVAIGVAVSFTPFIGLHLLLTFAAAWLMGANVVAAALGSVIGNPLTFPIMWASGYEVGYIILERANGVLPAGLAYEMTHKSHDQIMPLIEPLLIGSIPVGLAAGTLAYIATYKAVSVYQEARRTRLTDHRRRHSSHEGITEGRQHS